MASANSRTAQKWPHVHLPEEVRCYDGKSTDYFIYGERLASCKVAKHWLSVCVCVWLRGVLCLPLWGEGERERESRLKGIMHGASKKYHASCVHVR